MNIKDIYLKSIHALVAILLIKKAISPELQGNFLTFVLDPNKSRKKSINSKLRKDLASF